MKQPDPYLISICQQIEAAHGNTIKTIADAKRLSDDFYAKKLHISPHTLGRLFGVVKPFRKPYKDTLNLLAHYLNFSEWEDFCQNQTNIPFDPNFFLTETADGFSLAVLQLALASHDPHALLAVLNKIDPNCPLTLQIAAAELLGTHLRKLPNKRPLLQLLANNPMGQRLFYESFVDEDDEGGYYSHALQEYYLPNIQNNYRKLFVYAFLISKNVHHNKADSPYFDSFWHTTKQLTWEACHFHEKSRWLEVAVLHDGLNGTLDQTWTNLLEKALQELKNHSPYEQAWVLARLLKALLLFDMKEELCGHQAFIAAVDQLVQNQKKGHHSIALYALQLFWLYANVKRNKKQLYAPFRIHSTWFQNEANEKKAIEFGISYLFATGENQKIVSQFLPEFCHATGNTWVTRLLY